jgi:hypothetical protein
MVFSVEDTENIVRAARVIGISVTHVVYAGGALAAKVLGGDKGPSTNLVPFSLRSHLLPPYNNADLYPVSCWLLLIPIVVKVTDLISTARRVRTGYTCVPTPELATKAATLDYFYDKITSEAFDPSSITTPISRPLEYLTLCLVR